MKYDDLEWRATRRQYDLRMMQTHWRHGTRHTGATIVFAAEGYAQLSDRQVLVDVLDVGATVVSHVPKEPYDKRVVGSNRRWRYDAIDPHNELAAAVRRGRFAALQRGKAPEKAACEDCASDAPSNR